MVQLVLKQKASADASVEDSVAPSVEDSVAPSKGDKGKAFEPLTSESYGAAKVGPDPKVLPDAQVVPKGEKFATEKGAKGEKSVPTKVEESGA